jgi:hypothetical protein
MNERIQALLAKFKETESTHRGAHVLIGIDEIEKFAKLIVQECAQVASDYDGAHYVGTAIEKHFGVE